jgi:hypothetical protein
MNILNPISILAVLGFLAFIVPFSELIFKKGKNRKISGRGIFIILIGLSVMTNKGNLRQSICRTLKKKPYGNYKKKG